MKNISFNVILYNNRNLETFDIIPYLVRQYKSKKHKPNIRNHSELKKFIIDESKYQFWSRCEYEVIISSWPNDSNKIKIDVYDQIMWNIDTITKLLSQQLIGQYENSFL